MVKIDWAKLAEGRLRGLTDSEQLKNGFDNGSEKKHKGGKKNPEKTPQNNPDKKKVKNQAEIDRAEEKNEQIRRERAEIKQSVDDCLHLVADGLSQKNLSQKERVRLQWIQKRVEGAKSKIERDDNYSVEVMDASGNVVARRFEGVPVDDLAEVVSQLRVKTERDIRQMSKTDRNIKESRKAKHKYDLAATRADISGQEAKKKLAWYEVLHQLPADDRLKDEAYKEVAMWEEADRKNAEKEGKTFSGYDAEYKKQQLGEALRQRVEKYLKIDDKKLREELEVRTTRLGKYHNLRKALLDSSLPYFAFHYPQNFKKDGSKIAELNSDQQKEQDLYTQNEAGLIEKNSDYRGMLLDKFKINNMLPAGFDNLSEKQQDQHLAMLSLEDRLVLVLPKEQKVPDEQLEGSTATTPPVEVPPVLPPDKHKLENTNPPYDLENLAMSLPEVKVPDKKLFLIDISEIAKRMAQTKAEEKLRNHFDHKGGLFGKIVKNAWKGLSENHYRIKYYQESLKEIQNDNNLMRAISERVSGQQAPGGGARVSSEYLEMLDKVVAEYKHDVVDSQREVGDSMKNDPEIQERFAELLHRYRTNKWDGAAYNGLDKRASVELFVRENIANYINKRSSAKWTTDQDRTKEAKGLLYASNFYEICESIDKNYKEQIDAAVKEVMDKNPDAKIEAVRDAIAKQVEGIQGLNLQLGLKDRDLVNNRPKGILNLYEKMVDWGENHKVLGKILLNPFVVGAVATVTAQGVQRAIKWVAVGGAVAAGASGFWVPLGVGALAGGAYRAIKRGKDVEYDSAQELRHKTLGGKGSNILGEKGERSYDAVVMTFKEAMATVDSMKNKTTFTEVEKQQLAKIYARLQMERDLIADQSKTYTKLDLFSMEEDQGSRYGSNVSAKADLKIALKNLGIKEQDLQSMANVEKTAILDAIKQINEKQSGFKHKEMWKSFGGGAVMGFAGGILAQEAMHLGGQQLEKLWGGSYFKNQHTSLDKIVDWAKNSPYYQSHFGQGVVTGRAVEHIITGSRAQTSAEWLKGLKGNIAGGNVEQIHTQNFYDNPTGEAPHIHNDNELRFNINKDTGGSIHFKVPVEQGGSWMVHNQEFHEADLDKAFADGRIKMLFVPDGNNIHDAIVLDVDPTMHEVIIPKDSNIANLFDPETGRPKGTGFFGLAENTGARSDGSKNYTWISSDRNNGTAVDFGKVNITQEFIPDKPVIAPVEYDQTIATVPPQRKVFYRPGENEVGEKKKQKKAEKEAKKKKEIAKAKRAERKAEREKANAQAVKDAGHDDGGDHESGGGGGGGSQEDRTKKATSETTEAKAPEFKGDVLKRYLNPQYAAALFELYGQHTGLKKIDKKAIKFVVEGDAHKGKILKPDKATKAERAEAVWQMEQALIVGNIIKQNQIEEFYGDVMEDEIKNEAAAKATTPKAGAEATGKPGIADTTAGKTATIQTPDAGNLAVEAGKADFGSEGEKFLEKVGRKNAHFVKEGDQMPDAEKVKVLQVLEQTLDQLDSNVKKAVFTKFNPAHKGTELSNGVLLSFAQKVSKVGFGRDNLLHIPPTATIEDVKKTFVEYYEQEQERIKKRDEQKANAKTPISPVAPASPDATKSGAKEDLEKNYPAIMKHFKEEADKAGLTPGARAMYDKLLVEALPEALNSDPLLTFPEGLENIKIAFDKVDSNSNSITTVSFNSPINTIKFEIGGNDNGFNKNLEDFKFLLKYLV